LFKVLVKNDLTYPHKVLIHLLGHDGSAMMLRSRFLNTEDLTACASSKDNPMHWFKLIIVAVVCLLNQFTLDLHTYLAGNLRK
jgi:hypothetical protein